MGLISEPPRVAVAWATGAPCLPAHGNWAGWLVSTSSDSAPAPRILFVTVHRNAKDIVKPKDTAKRLYSKAQGREAHPGNQTPTQHKTLKGFYKERVQLDDR